MNKNVLDELIVVKRSGQRVSFNGAKIAVAIKSAFEDIYETYDENEVNFIFNEVINYITKEYQNRKTINVEDIQDIIEDKLKEHGFNHIYEAFNKYRESRRISRETFQIKQKHKFVKVIEEVSYKLEKEKDKSGYDLLISSGKAINKEFAKSYLIDNKYLRSHDEGSIYIHDLDVYGLNGFISYHIDLTTVICNDLLDYTYKILDILFNTKKDISGYINVPNIDKLYYNIFLKDQKETLKNKLLKYLTLDGFEEYFNFKKINDVIDKVDTIFISEKTFEQFITNEKINFIFKKAIEDTFEEISCKLKLCLNKLILELNNVKGVLKNSKYSLSVSDNSLFESYLVSQAIYEIINENNFLENVSVIIKLGNDLNNIAFPVNKNIYLLNSDKTNIEYFASGQRVYENYWNEDASTGKMTVGCVTVNLPRIGIISKTEEEYFKYLKEIMDLSKNELLQEFELKGNKYKDNFEILFNSDYFNVDLDDNQKIRKIIKNGTLQIGIIGLYESVVAFKKNFDEKFALKVLSFMKEKVLEYTKEEKLNFTLTAIYSRKVNETLIKIDKSVYGSILNITDKKYYSFGVNIDEKNQDFAYQKKLEENLNGGMICLIDIPKKASNKKIIELIKQATENKMTFIGFKNIWDEFL